MFGIHGLPVHSVKGPVLGLVWLLAGVSATVSAAYWVVTLMSPRPVAALPAMGVGAAPVSLKDALKVFGSAEVVVPQSLGIELTGVYAAKRNRGFATFSSSQGSHSVAVGQEIQPGLRLVTAAARHVIVRGKGGEWRLELKQASVVRKARNSNTVAARS